MPDLLCWGTENMKDIYTSWRTIGSLLRSLESGNNAGHKYKYSVILSVLYPRKCEYLKDYSLDFNS